MDGSRQIGAGKGAKEGSWHGVRAQGGNIRGTCQGAGSAVAGGKTPPGRHVHDAQNLANRGWAHGLCQLEPVAMAPEQLLMMQM